MSSSPKVSVIIPIYNTEKYLRECLDSIINQTLTDIEVICINDGSTDTTADILMEYRFKDNRVNVFYKENGGLSSARNMGLKHANGEYLYFLDSDDKLLPNALELLYDISTDKNLDVLYFDGESFYETTEIQNRFSLTYTNYYKRRKAYDNIVLGAELFVQMQEDDTYRCSVCLQFIKRSYLESINLSFYEGIIYEDNIFSFLCIMQAKRASHLKKILFLRRVRADSIMTKSEIFKNFYGYFICFIQMKIFSITKTYDMRTQNAIDKVINGVFNNALRIYRKLPDRERILRKMMSPQEQFMFLYIIVPKLEPAQTNIDIDLERLRYLENELKKVYSSFFFKLGVFLTFIPRKIRSGIKCYQEHGLMYTIHRVIKKYKP